MGLARGTLSRHLESRPYRRRRPLKVGLEPDPINGPILLHMYQHIAAGGGIVPLKYWLEARAIPAPKGGVLWQEASIRHILHNSTNWGERRSFATRTVPHSQGARRRATEKSRVRHEPVPLELQYEVDPSVIRTIPDLDRDLAIRTLAVLAENRRQHQIAVRGANVVTEAERAERGLLFGGMVKCGTCGGGLRLKHGLRNNWMYYCSHHGTYHAGEPSISMSSRLLDPVVWRYATYAISEPAFFERLLQQTDEVAGPAVIASAQQQTLAEAEHERDILQKHLRRLDPDDPDNAGLVASVDDDLRRVVARIASLSRALDASRAAVEAEEARRGTLAAFHAYAERERETLDQKTRLEQHQMLRVLQTRARLRAEGSTDRIRIVFDIRHLPGAAAWLRPDLSKTPSGYVDFGPDNLPLVSLEVLQTEGAEPFGEMTFDETSDAEWQERGFASEEEYLEWTMQKTVEDTPVEEPPVVPAGRWHLSSTTA